MKDPLKDLVKLLVVAVLATVASVVITSRNSYNIERDFPQRALHGSVVRELTEDEKLSQCLSDNMCKYLAEGGYWEARSEPDKGVKAVMFVILQRVADERRWKGTVKGVLREPGQFEYVSRGLHLKGFAEKQRYKQIVLSAHKVVNGDTINPVPKANHFHKTSFKRVWTKNMRVVAVIGNHVFFEG